MSSDLKIKNTFAPNFRNKEFTVGGLIVALKTGFIHADSLPPDVRKLVTEEIERRQKIK